MKLSDMETVLKRYGFDSNDPLLVWINAAMHDLEDAFDWPWLESNETPIVVAPGSNSITLPATALKIITIRDAVNRRKLVYFDRHKFVREVQDPTEKGLAEIYTLLSTNEVQIWRVIETSTEFQVVYQGKTPDLVNGPDEPTTENNVWPVNTHYPIVMRAASIALMAENEEERAKMAQTEFDQALSRLMVKFGQRELDEPTTVVDIQGYGGADDQLRYGT